MRSGRALKHLLVLALILQLAYPLTAVLGQDTASGAFVLLNYSHKSRAGTEEVYPGSRDVVLTASLLYNGSVLASSAYACIELPEGFTVTRGYAACTSLKYPNGTTATVLNPGDVVIAEYHFDISSNVSPGVYYLSMRVYYTTSSGQNVQVVENLEVRVSEYPRLSLEVAHWYWSPAGYPGSEGVYLYVVLKNAGKSRIVEASCVLRLPERVFVPGSVSFQFSNLGSGEMLTLSLGPISISPEAQPNYPYKSTIEVNATMSTEDGVTYSDRGEVTFNLSVSQPPSVLLRVVDYGLETAKPVGNAVSSRFYITLQNRDFRTVNSITAYFIIRSQNATFIDGSLVDVVVLNRILQYGDTATIASSPVVLTNAKTLVVDVVLEVFGSENGAEFWSTVSYTLATELKEPSIDFRPVDAYWSQGEVYPGTENAVLNVVLGNYDVAYVVNALVALELPEGFYPRTAAVLIAGVQPGSLSTAVFEGISISQKVSSGLHPAKLSIVGFARDASSGAYYEFRQNYTILLAVFEKPATRLLKPLAHGWVGGAAYTTMVNARFYVYFQATSPGLTLRGLSAEVFLPPQMVFRDGNSTAVLVVSGNYGYGSQLRVESPDIVVATERSGLYPVVVRVSGMAASTTGSEFWFEEYYTLLLRVDEPSLNISLADYSWGVQVVGASTRGASFRVVLQSLSTDAVRSLVARLELLNAVFSSGTKSSAVALNAVLDYGSVATVEFGGIELENATRLEAVLKLEAVLSTQASYYRASATYRLSVDTRSNLKAFRVVAVSTGYRGQYSPLLPSARGVEVTVTLASEGPYPVAWVQPSVVLPGIMKLNSVGGTCIGGVEPGGTCTLTLDIDVAPAAEPGTYRALLYLTYAVRSGQALSVFSEEHTLYLAVASFDYYKPSLSLVSAYWGVQAPTRALVGQRNAPLTVVVANTGYYHVEAVQVVARPESSLVEVFVNSAACSQYLDPGSFCSATLYADLLNVTSKTTVKFVINVSYLFTVYGISVVGYQLFTAELVVDEAASGRGLLLVDSRWSNNWPAYPGTENATLVVTFANKWPYSVSGLELELELPEGLYAKSGGVAKCYVSGPVRSLQEFSCTFTISIGDITPGTYKARLIASYVVESGTPNARAREEFEVSIVVNDPQSAIGFVTSAWVGKVPEPPEYGAVYMVVFRNNAIPSMSGVVLELELPEGMYGADTNTSRLAVPASSINILEQLGQITQPQQAVLEQVLSLLRQLQLAQQPQQTYRPGDMLYFYLRLNIVVDKPGTYTAKGYLNFVDHWGCVRRIPVEIGIVVLGSAKIVEVHAPSSITVEKGLANMQLRLENTGSSPLYNVYVYLVPQSPILLPSEAVKYVGVLEPGLSKNISFALVYNPVALTTGLSQAYVRYTTALFTLGIVYTDVSGYTRVFNTTIAVLIEPFIDLALSGLKATLSGSLLVVSGTIVNYGISPARSVVVRVTYGGASGEALVGDVDPASQAAFRVEVPGATPSGSNAVVEVIYRDEYGRTKTLSSEVPVVVKAESTPAPAAQTPAAEYVHYAVTIALVAVFLLAVAYMIYRFLKVHARHGSESAGEAAGEAGA
ncbi:MAG: hypothetical protein ACP5KA_04505 [Desulfurococcaceae archaeon]